MTVRDLVLYPDPLLQARCRPVEAITAEVRQLIDDMVETMYDAPGVGLAAPQVGSDLRIVVMDCSDKEAPAELRVLINPEIVARRGELVWEEGCLSIPGVYDKVTRAAHIRVRALDREGKPIEFEAEELLSVCVQHELDHLNGVLFLDHLSRLKRRIAERAFKKNLPTWHKEQEEKRRKREAGEAPSPPPADLEERL